MNELASCPFCGCIENLDISLHQAKRYGKYDAAVYCRKCYAYGPRVKSEDIALPDVDIRNESITMPFKQRLKIAAIRAWNNRRYSEVYSFAPYVPDDAETGRFPDSISELIQEKARG